MAHHHKKANHARKAEQPNKDDRPNEADRAPPTGEAEKADQAPQANQNQKPDRMDLPDVRQLDGEGLPEAKFPGSGRRDFRVFVEPEPHDAIARHARENTRVEIGGVLVGSWERDADGPFVRVAHAIRCDAAVSRSGEVTFTHEAWNFINREMDTRFTELKIVGWYHSHPGFGIWLSERDVFIQQHFFGNPGQIAFVVDPLNKVEGVFAWRRGKPAPCPHYWVGDRIVLSAEGAAKEPASRPEAAPRAAAPLEKAALPVTWSSALLAICPYVLLFLVGYLLADTKTKWEQRTMIEGTVARYGPLALLMHGGLGEELGTSAARLQRISQAVDKLAKEHVELAGEDADEKKEQWKEVHDALAVTKQSLSRIGRAYDLTPEEKSVLEQILLAKQKELQRQQEQAGEAGTATSKTGEPRKSAQPEKTTQAPPKEPQGAEKTAAGKTTAEKTAAK
jgi:proteasome lid subunit RPN8/RPN11